MRRQQRETRAAIPAKRVTFPEAPHTPFQGSPRSTTFPVPIEMTVACNPSAHSQEPPPFTPTLSHAIDLSCTTPSLAIRLSSPGSLMGQHALT